MVFITKAFIVLIKAFTFSLTRLKEIEYRAALGTINMRVGANALNKREGSSVGL